MRASWGPSSRGLHSPISMAARCPGPGGPCQQEAPGRGRAGEQGGRQRSRGRSRPCLPYSSQGDKATWMELSVPLEALVSSCEW